MIWSVDDDVFRILIMMMIIITMMLIRIRYVDDGRRGQKWFGWEVGWDDPIRWQPDAKKWIIRLSSRRLYFNANHLISWMKKNSHFNLMVLINTYVGCKSCSWSTYQAVLVRDVVGQLQLVEGHHLKFGFELKLNSWRFFFWAHWNLFPAVFTSTI